MFNDTMIILGKGDALERGTPLNYSISKKEGDVGSNATYKCWVAHYFDLNFLINLSY